jgi:hypothetical protein
MNQVMEVDKMSNLALLLVLALCMSQPLITNALELFGHVSYTVHVQNWFGNETIILQAHCKSGDLDLGLQHISMMEQIEWRFQINFWDTTLYFCNLSWVGGHRTFDVFTAQRNFIHNKCAPSINGSKKEKDCIWRAQYNGIYVLDAKTQAFLLQYTWKPW